MKKNQRLFGHDGPETANTNVSENVAGEAPVAEVEQEVPVVEEKETEE